MNLKPFFLILSFLLLIGCGSQGSIPQGPRTIFFSDGDSLTENDSVSFESWKCHEFMSNAFSPKTLVEVGIINGIEGIEGIGFVLYDGTDSGVMTFHRRQGINHRWNWEADDNDGFNYSFVLETDGTGLFYDFTTVATGETAKARDLFTCKK